MPPAKATPRPTARTGIAAPIAMPYEVLASAPALMPPLILFMNPLYFRLSLNCSSYAAMSFAIMVSSVCFVSGVFCK